jgi:hypothetical protein
MQGGKAVFKSHVTAEEPVTAFTPWPALIFMAVPEPWQCAGRIND